MGKTKKKQEIDNRYEISLVDFITNPDLGLSIMEKVKRLDNLMTKNERFSNIKKIADSNLEECEEFKQMEKLDENLILEDTILSEDYSIADEIIETSSRKNLMYYKYAIEKESQEDNPIIVQKDDYGYVEFFTYKIKTLKAQDGYDDFLSYHQKKFEKEKIIKYINTLKIAINILNKDVEYSSYTSSIEDFVSNLLNKKNDKFIIIDRNYDKTRNNDKGATVLDAEQTAYLFYKLSDENIIFKKEDYLNVKNLAYAIEALTGFSPKNMKNLIPKAKSGELHQSNVSKVNNLMSKIFKN